MKTNNWIEEVNVDNRSQKIVQFSLSPFFLAKYWLTAAPGLRLMAWGAGLALI